MVDSSPHVHPGVDPRAIAEHLPPDLRAKLEERAQIPERRLMIGRYVVIGELGRGGMGIVFDAWDPGIERRVAIKTLEPDLVPDEDRDEVIERFRRETKIVGKLHHPGIVTIFDYGEEKERGKPTLYYYVMEYLEGRSLADVLRERPLIPDVEAAEIVAEVLEALHVTHGAGVVHRDLKPSNIFLRRGKDAVILDFGIAKTGVLAITRQGEILGTPSFLAPERIKEREHPVDGRADIFSLGVLLYTMISGEAPFAGNDVYEVIDKITRTSHQKIARVTPAGQALSRCVDRMLEKAPEDRYANANDAALAIRHVLTLLRAMNVEQRTIRPNEVDVRALMRVDPERATDIESATSPLEEVHEVDSDAYSSITSTDIGDDTVDGEQSVAEPPSPLLVTTNPEPGLIRETRRFGEDEAFTTREIDRGAFADERDTFDGEKSAHDTVDRPIRDSIDRPALSLGSPFDDGSLDETLAEGDRSPIRAPSLVREEAEMQARRRRDDIDAAVFDDHSAADVENTARSADLPGPGDLTQPAYKREQDTDDVQASDGNSVVKARGDSRVLDPAERDRTPSFGSALRALEPAFTDESSDVDFAGSMPGVEAPLNAAVARKTIGRSKSRAAKPAVQIRVSGNVSIEKMRVVRRRGFMLTIAMLSAVAVGLFLGRLRTENAVMAQPGSDTKRSLIEPRVKSALSEATSGSVPPLVTPPPVHEVIQEASAAFAEGQAVRAEQLYERAVRAAPERSMFRAQALLGRADALRQLSRRDEAIEIYRALLAEYPKSDESESAKVALTELGVVIGQKKPVAAQHDKRVDEAGTVQQETKIETKPELVRELSASMTPDEKCLALAARHIQAPEESVKAFSALGRQDPKSSCVYWHLGVAYEKLKDDSAALYAYRRYLELKPDTNRRRAVEDRIKHLETKLEER